MNIQALTQILSKVHQDSFHDASLYEFQLISYDDVEDSYEYYGGVGIDISSSLSPGDYILYSEVGYDSSSLAYVYDWNMTYTVTDSVGSTYYYMSTIVLIWKHKQHTSI